MVQMILRMQPNEIAGEKSLRPGRNYAMLRNRSRTPTEGDSEGCATWLCIPARCRNNARIPWIHMAVVVTPKQLCI
ncbi:hypothetical protein T11_1666 [Trichinella zimbabwensis]|uniref:Uncharacterized protein n=1 Tax=Trichinella zimbabwensis TaxID=268475 RepID=A0A0V1I125_9BILA|nr:hypothetical protein T11_1666 [Trichinella zimbabwensis]